MRITALYIYPVKGCRGIPVDEMEFDAHGPRDDRRWMLVDGADTMVTQRNTPGLARIEVAVVEGDRLALIGPAAQPRVVEPPSAAEPLREVEVWRDRVWGRDTGNAAAEWFSQMAEKPVRLLHLAPERPRRRSWNEEEFSVGFADGYPLLVCHEASLADLNRRLVDGGAEPVQMDRFRPNIVVEGDIPWAEDHWQGLQAEAGIIECATGCARCTVTTVDQQSGAIPYKTEPLATLAQFRKQAHGVIFGRNALGLPCGARLRIGSSLRLLA